MARAPVLALVAASLLLSAPVPAEPSTPPAMKSAARARLEAGMRHFRARAYEAAAREFREGYRIQPHRDFLYALGQSARLSNDCAGAIESYQAFLETNPPPNEAEMARYNIGRCRASLEAAERMGTPSDSTSTATVNLPPKAPPPIEEAVPARESSGVSPLPAVEVPPQPPAAWYDDGLALALSGTAIAAIGVSAGGWIVGNHEARLANSAPTIGDFGDRMSAAQRARTIAVVAGVAGASLLAIAIVRFVAHASE
jgi:hypothetical protein